LNLYRPRTGEKVRPMAEVIDLTTRAAHEQELFSPPDWDFIQWLAQTYGEDAPASETIHLTGVELLQWLARWGDGFISTQGFECMVEILYRAAQLKLRISEVPMLLDGRKRAGKSKMRVMKTSIAYLKLAARAVAGRL
jgi:hypothetical protein